MRQPLCGRSPCRLSSAASQLQPFGAACDAGTPTTDDLPAAQVWPASPRPAHARSRSASCPGKAAIGNRQRAWLHSCHVMARRTGLSTGDADGSGCHGNFVAALRLCLQHVHGDGSAQPWHEDRATPLPSAPSPCDAAPRTAVLSSPPSRGLHRPGYSGH